MLRKTWRAAAPPPTSRNSGSSAKPSMKISDARSRGLELEESTGTRIWEPVGVAWFARSEDGFEARSRASLDRLGVPYEWLDPDEAPRLYPSLKVDDLTGVLFEPEAGVLHARRATQLLVEAGERAGVRFESGRCLPADDPRGDVVVWACGPWLASLFPQQVELKVTRRDVFFFGADASWRGTPGFCEYDAAYYGHGEIAGLGVKVAPDLPGEEIDPDTVERTPLPSWEQAARSYAARRFPALAAAPVIGTRVCQYDLSSDTHFIVDRHPERDSWWLIGGSSGPSTWPTASRESASASRSTRSAGAPATRVCGPPPTADHSRPPEEGRQKPKSELQRCSRVEGGRSSAGRVRRRGRVRGFGAGHRQAPGAELDPRRRELHQSEP